jgi:hypothetical protein
MITEVEVDGIGIMRHLNDWQISRIRRITDRQNRSMALPAFSLGMSLQQYKKLSPQHRHAAWEAYCRLTSPEAMLPEGSSEPQPAPLPRPWERISYNEQRALGRKLLAVKAALPRGHFGPWLRDKSGLSRTQAARYMCLARKIT